MVPGKRVVLPSGCREADCVSWFLYLQYEVTVGHVASWAASEPPLGESGGGGGNASGPPQR